MAQKITFTVSAEIVETATSGILLGDFNNWNFEQGIALILQKDGSLKATVALESGTYQYRYFLSDGRWVNDGNADAYVYSEGFFIDNCVITVPAEAPKATKTKKETPVPVVEAAPVAKKAAPKKIAVKAAEPIAVVAPIVEVVAPAKKAATKAAEAKPTKAAKAKK